MTDGRTFYERLASVETDQRNEKDMLADMEARLRRLERAMWAGVGALAGLQIFLKYAV